MSGSVDFNDGWREGRKALIREIAALPEFIALVQHPDGYNPAARRWAVTPVLHACWRKDDVLALADAVERHPTRNEET
jgi:hypothetical protein